MRAFNTIIISSWNANLHNHNTKNFFYCGRYSNSITLWIWFGRSVIFCFPLKVCLLMFSFKNCASEQTYMEDVVWYVGVEAKGCCCNMEMQKNLFHAPVAMMCFVLVATRESRSTPQPIFPVYPLEAEKLWATPHHKDMGSLNVDSQEVHPSLLALHCKARIHIKSKSLYPLKVRVVFSVCAVGQPNF